MDSVVTTSQNETEEVDLLWDPVLNFDVADILDLEIFNFDMEELAANSQQADDLNLMIRSRNLVGIIV